MSGFGFGMLQRALADGIMAERKMNGDTDIYASDDPDTLKAIIEQGKDAEADMLRMGRKDMVEHIHKRYGEWQNK